MTTDNWKPHVGDWVEVLAAGEILATLDDAGRRDRMPFMPEMLRHAGRRYRVSAVAHKTCDTVNRTGGRSVRATVHLEDLRCDGGAHGGCQAACLLFWKTDWLRPVDGPAPGQAAEPAAADPASAPAVLRNAASTTRGDGVTVYSCQATTLPQWTDPLAWWDVRQYWRDVSSGNFPARHVLVTLFLAGVRKLRRLPRATRTVDRLYGRLHLWLRGTPDPHGEGGVPRGTPTPDQRLELQVGEVVRIKPKDEVYSTVNPVLRNRGLQIDEEMTKYCGGRFTVTRRVTQIINEGTGEMMRFGNPCIVLGGADCMGEYSDKRLMCPRRITTYWREIWLERVDGEPPRSA